MTAIVASCVCAQASLTYAQAQLILDNPKRDDEIARSLRHLNRLARILKQRRLENGHVRALLYVYMQQSALSSIQVSGISNYVILYT